MTAVPFDTLKLAERLQAGGFTPEQSRSAAAAFADAMSGADLVTRDHLDAKLSETKSDILRWMFGAMAAQTALIVALVKLIH